MLKRFISYYRPHMGLFALDMSMAFTNAVCSVIVPMLARLMLSDYLPAGNLKMVWVTIAGSVLLTVIITVSTYINTRWGHILGARMETDMRSDLFGHLQKLSFTYYDKTKTGHIMSRIANDLFNISELAHHGPENLFISLFIIIGSFVVMFHINMPLATLTFIPLPLMLAWGLYYRLHMRQGFRNVRKRIADINSSVENSIQGIREVKSFTNEDFEIEKFQNVNLEFRSAKERMYSVMAVFHSVMMFLMTAYHVIVVGGGVVLAYFGRISISDVLVFVIYVRFIVRPIHSLVQFAEQLQEGGAAFERFTEIMDIEPDITDVHNPESPASLRGHILVTGLSFKYESTPDWILKDVNMEIQPGQKIALVGESGAGKSTLASLIPRFYQAQKGTITIDGHDVLRLRQRFLRESIGIVQQNTFIFDTTLRENILFGRPDASEEEIMQAVRNANIAEFVDSLPEGLDTMCGEHGVKLSGGQKQRVSIARVFLKNPPILIFDEATASLDSETERLIGESMDKLLTNRTTIVIAHRLSTVRNADSTYVMKQGCVIEHGTHDELLAMSGHYSRLYENALI